MLEVSSQKVVEMVSIQLLFVVVYVVYFKIALDPPNSVLVGFAVTCRNLPCIFVDFTGSKNTSFVYSVLWSTKIKVDSVCKQNYQWVTFGISIISELNKEFPAI